MNLGVHQQALAETVAGAEVDQGEAVDCIELIRFVAPQVLSAVGDEIERQAQPVIKSIVGAELELMGGNAGNAVAGEHGDFALFIGELVIRAEHLEIILESGADKTVGGEPF